VRTERRVGTTNVFFQYHTKSKKNSFLSDIALTSLPVILISRLSVIAQLPLFLTVQGSGWTASRWWECYRPPSRDYVASLPAIVVLVLGFLLIKGDCYLLGIQGTNPIVNLIAYGGYKFVGCVVAR